MKKFKFLTLAALAASMTVSCGKSGETENSGRVEVKFSSNGTATVQTRVSGNNWDGNENAGIYMLAGDYSLTSANISEGAGNREYRNAAAGLTATFTPNGAADTIYYPVSGDVKFIAYYPYGTVTDGSTTFTRAIDLSSANQGNQSAIDFMYAAAAAAYNKNSGTVTLPFVHKLVKLEFTVENGDGVNESLANGLTVKISGQATTGTMDLTDGSVTTGNSGQTVTLTATANGTKAEAIVFEGAKAGKQFTFTNNAGETFTADIPDNFEAGKKYIYAVTLNKNAAQIQGTIENWITGANTGVDAK